MNENQNNNNTHNTEEANNSANMYSYNDGNEINNNQPQKEPDAIRRSLGEINPYGMEPNNNNEEYDQNANNRSKPNTADHPNYEDKSSEERLPNIKESYSPFNVSPPLYQQEQSHVYRPPPREQKKFYFIFGFFILILQIIFILGIGFSYEYKYHNGSWENENDDQDFYFYFQFFKDVILMIFIGFGLLYTSLKDHQWSSVGNVLLIGVFSFEVTFIWNHLWWNAFNKRIDDETQVELKPGWSKLDLNYDKLITIAQTSATALISLGAIIGKFSLIHYLLIAFFETLFASFNYYLCYDQLNAIDNGGSLYIHTFGAIFGVSVSIVNFCSSQQHSKISSSPHLSSNYYSNIISFIGSIFLWLYFPSFNVANIQCNDDKEYKHNINKNISEILRYRGIVNTYLSMIGSAIATFVVSPLISKGKLKMEHLLNASYVGGIIIGGCCTICSMGWGAILIGSIGGAISVLFLGLLKKILKEKKFEDTFGILGTFCIPGILGGFLNSIFMGNFNNMRWGGNSINRYFDVGNRKPSEQAGIQIAAIFITLGIASVTGICIGFLARIMNCDKNEIYFVDSEYFYEDEKIVLPEWKYPRINPS